MTDDDDRSHLPHRQGVGTARPMGTTAADLDLWHTAVAAEFNDAINERDLDGLARLMTNDHEFIDTAGDVA